ncbi:hypothetical protein CR513_04128, partial [Mucuna pruriens]
MAGWYVPESLEGEKGWRSRYRYFYGKYQETFEMDKTSLGQEHGSESRLRRNNLTRVASCSYVSPEQWRIQSLHEVPYSFLRIFIINAMSSRSKVLVIENREKSQKKRREGGREKSKSKSKSKYKNVKCHYCHKIGIYRSIVSCGKERTKAKKGKSKEKNHDDDDDRTTPGTGDDLSVNLVSDESMWIIDSGATLHVTLRKKFFTSYTSSDFRVLKMGNDGMSKDMLPGLKNAKLDKCSHYMTDKQIRVSFKKHPPLRKLELLELVHYDVCDPLKTKDQMLEKFKQFKALVERQSDKKGKTLYTTVHVINLNPIFDLNTEVPDKIWFGKDVNCDVQLIDDQTIEDIDKNGKKHDYVDDQQLGNVFDVPLDDDAEEEQEIQSSTKYPSDEYVTLTDGEEPEYYQEAIGSEEGQKWLDAIQDEIKSLHGNHTYDLVKFAKGKKVLENRWIYRIKQESNFTSPRHSPSNEVEKTSMNRVPYTFAVGSLMYAMDTQTQIYIDSRKPTSNYLIKFAREAVTWQSKLQKSNIIDVRYHWICDALDAKLLELAKVHIYDNGADMITKNG